jgi:cytochrome c peroxidase
MNNLVHNVRTPALVVQDVRNAAYAPLFRRVFGEKVFSLPTAQIFAQVAEAVAAYEEAPEVSPFTSRYDAHLLGRAALSPSELHGLRLVTGSMTGRPGGPPHKNAICSACHGIPSDPTTGPDLWSLYCYVNIGVPKNAANPYYKMTDTRGNPLGYNPQGAAFIDLGLGSYLYPLNGLPSGNMGPNGNGQGDFLAVNGTFKVPTLRNVDRRPDAGFVKPYMHNGVFKSLEQVVHFYNTRNLTTVPGELIDFTQPDPYAGLKGQPLWPPPEFPSLVTLQNPTGAIGSINAQVGNLGLTPEEEADIVAFLRTLRDGYFQR